MRLVAEAERDALMALADNLSRAAAHRGDAELNGLVRHELRMAERGAPTDSVRARVRGVRARFDLLAAKHRRRARRLALAA